jgi:hypothetical protein
MKKSIQLQHIPLLYIQINIKLLLSKNLENDYMIPKKSQIIKRMLFEYFVNVTDILCKKNGINIARIISNRDIN